MSRNLTVLLAAVMLAFAPVAAVAQISPGTTLVGTIDQPLDSRTGYVGQPFTISDAHSPDHHVNGATIYGHVASVQHAGQGTPGRITLAFDRVRTRSGNAYHISGYASRIDVVTKNNALKEVGGAAAGALVGGLLFHGVGALIGAGTGALVAKNNRQNVTISQGSTVSVQVVRSLRQST